MDRISEEEKSGDVAAAATTLGVRAVARIVAVAERGSSSRITSEPCTSTRTYRGFDMCVLRTLYRSDFLEKTYEICFLTFTRNSWLYFFCLVDGRSSNGSALCGSSSLLTMTSCVCPIERSQRDGEGFIMAISQSLEINNRSLLRSSLDLGCEDPRRCFASSILHARLSTGRRGWGKQLTYRRVRGAPGGSRRHTALLLHSPGIARACRPWSSTETPPYSTFPDVTFLQSPPCICRGAVLMNYTLPGTGWYRSGNA